MTSFEGTDNTAAVTARQIKQIFDNNLVHRSGDETIDGNKTFNSNIRFTRSTEGFQTVSSKNLSLTLGTHPVNDTGLQIYAQDKDDDGYNNRIGGLFTYYTKEGVCATRITAYKPDKTDIYNGVDQRFAYIFKLYAYENPVEYVRNLFNSNVDRVN